MGNMPSETRDMPLPPGEYMHVQDTTTGQVKTYVGPMVVNQTGQEQPVKYDADDRRFDHTDLHGSRRKCVFVPEDSYCSLYNPAIEEGGDLLAPYVGKCSNPAVLLYGERVNVPGPAHFALWPEQAAMVIEGHRLRSNQYLLVEVVNGHKAQDNWEQATVETAEGEDVADKVAKQATFRTGELLIIKGTEAGFFIPCTGMRVVPDGRKYVRDAMTLEQLEFCILVDESGKKRYERGPQVVFPEPTEEFWTDDKQNKKFRAYELSKISGIYVKVIAPYTETVGEKTVKHEAGEELFITGKETPIYYPRPEHAIVKYGDSEMHFATAVTKGEGRYVLDRLAGRMKTEHGEQMLLPDPRTHVIVNRILTDNECKLWFPKSTVALQHNRTLRAQATSADIGYVERSADLDEAMASSQLMMSASVDSDIKRSRRVKGGRPAMADAMERSATYTPPRSITLDSKFDGAVQIQVWTGFAVMVVGKDGGRKAVIGPDTVLLDYDQTLEVLRLSTGKPKNTDHLYQTVYLNVMNNKVSDIVNVHTQDQVEVNIKLSFHVDFEGEPEKWFNVENYVKLLCDRVRSILKGVIRGVKIEDLFANHVSLIRDTVLGPHNPEGAGRKGMTFASNGMKIIDVDVLGFEIPDRTVADELITAQRQALATSLQLQNKQREVEATERSETLERQLALARAETGKLQHSLHLEDIAAKEAAAVRLQEAHVAEGEARQVLAELKETVKDLEHSREVARDKLDHEEEILHKKGVQDVRLAGIAAETEAHKERLSALSDKLAATLEGAIQAGALQTVAEKGLHLSEVSNAPVMDTLRRGLGNALANRFASAADGFLDDVAATHVEDID